MKYDDTQSSWLYRWALVRFLRSFITEALLRTQYRQLHRSIVIAADKEGLVLGCDSQGLQAVPLDRTQQWLPVSSASH